MRPEIKFQSITISISTLLIFAIWIGLTKITNVSDWIKLLITGLMSFGVYKAVIITLLAFLRNVQFIKKFILGPYYLEGTWVGFYIGASGKVRYMIESFEQEIDSLVIRGKCFDENLNYHSTWLSNTTNIDAKKGILSYMYDVDTLRDISNNVGIASFRFERESQYKPTKKLMGFSADLHKSKKIKGIEIKMEKKCTDNELLEQAQTLYSDYKNQF